MDGRGVVADGVVGADDVGVDGLADFFRRSSSSCRLLRLSSNNVASSFSSSIRIGISTSGSSTFGATGFASDAVLALSFLNTTGAGKFTRTGALISAALVIDSERE